MSTDPSKAPLAIVILTVGAELPLVARLAERTHYAMKNVPGVLDAKGVGVLVALVFAGPVLGALSSANLMRANRPRWAFGLHLVPLACALVITLCLALLAALDREPTAAYLMLPGLLLGVAAAVLTGVALLRR